jgi:hypothetical protein
VSAFIVAKEHINAILLAGLSVRYKPFTWYYNEKQRQLISDNADEIGQMLLDENVASVAYRYPDDSLSQLPGRTNSEWLYLSPHRKQDAHYHRGNQIDNLPRISVL